MFSFNSAVVCSVLCVLAATAGAHAQPTYSARVYDNAPSLAQALGQRAMLQQTEETGDEAAQRAQDLALTLMQKAGVRGSVAITATRTSPVAVGGMQIWIPAQGMSKYSEAELHFVLAHEIAHVKLKHFERKTALALALCAQDLPSEQYLECAVSNLSLQSPVRDSIEELEREQEHQADAWAIRYLHRHKIPSEPATALRRAYGPGNTEGHGTHPDLDERLHRVRAIQQSLN